MAYKITDPEKYAALTAEIAFLESELKAKSAKVRQLKKESHKLLKEYFDPSDYHPEYLALIDKFIADNNGVIPEKFEHDRHFHFCEKRGWNIEGYGPAVYYRDVALRIKDAKN